MSTINHEKDADATDGAKPSIINCHTHIFTGDHVPPWLAKTFLPCPLFFILPVSGVVKLLRWWFNGPNTFFYGPTYKRIVRTLYNIRMFVARKGLLRVLSYLLGAFVTLNVFFFFFYLIAGVIAPPAKEGGKVRDFGDFLEKWWIISKHPNIFLMLLYILLLLLFFQWGRNLILFVFRQLWKFMGMLPGKKSVDLLKRYVLIGRYSRYKGQGGIFSKLKAQYPNDTGFVILPMDMHFMDAGNAKFDIAEQMEELVKVKDSHKNTLFPFVFADPRRMQDQSYFNYSVGAGGEVILGECLMQQLLEGKEFSGLKIYPALGYYPFDPALLPLWKYAVQKDLPIITHCIRGTIFYRGRKKKEWDEHPLFEQAMGEIEPPDGETENEAAIEYCKLLLPQRKNVDFTPNFTHPLNYLCLLEELLLRELVGQARDPRIKSIFGYNGDDKPMDRHLGSLKMCFGHFGGDDEWRRFMELDRDLYSKMLVTNPDRGVEFLFNNNSARKERRRGKPEQVWKYVDWYTIICSLLLQYPNTYADISYILHDPQILPLLKQTLRHPVLRQRTLYGTDFYVVRNHKSDKEMLASMRGGLSEDDFDEIARINPRIFLNIWKTRPGGA